MRLLLEAGANKDAKIRRVRLYSHARTTCRPHTFPTMRLCGAARGRGGTRRRRHKTAAVSAKAATKRPARLCSRPGRTRRRRIRTARRASMRRPKAHAVAFNKRFDVLAVASADTHLGKELRRGRSRPDGQGGEG